ncbi:cobalamin-binding protein [Zobellella denitrificans]|jgi:vitamin B12 transport system substrate-binding protein|uniref:cobalamin-binding protein n=1 Tax=Zobellella denitrificans TaxID=347534 RepID=UPI000B8C17AE|nr:cobalamin-binding protein [Zobellella denitrificans]OXS13945.1 cobalamin-binding protein [Zobellella denitrificans]
MARLLLLFMLCGAVQAAEPARRIVSLSPHITEMLFAIGAGPRVVAVDEASDYPPAALALPRIANYRSLNLERILALQPDLVLAWRSAQQVQVQPLLRLGIPVAYSEPLRLQDLAEELIYLGALTGQRRQARAVAAHYLQQLDALAQRYQGVRPVSVFYQLGSAPLMSVNDGTWMGQAIRLCGGVNVMADSPAPYPQLNAEFVLARDPEVILASNEQELALWRQWPALRAVQGERLLTVDADLLHRFTPRTPEGIRQLCRQLDRARAE